MKILLPGTMNPIKNRKIFIILQRSWQSWNQAIFLSYLKISIFSFLSKSLYFLFFFLSFSLFLSLFISFFLYSSFSLSSSLILYISLFFSIPHSLSLPFSLSHLSLFFVWSKTTWKVIKNSFLQDFKLSLKFRDSV